MEEIKNISVIIPVYNAESYLDECLSSVCAQTYPSFEVILIDDGSTDGSWDIASRFAKKNSRFRLIHTENGGVSKARNLGISLAEARYLCFVDADDFVEPDFLKRLISEIGDAEICVGAKRRWNQDQHRTRCDGFPAFSGTVRDLTRRLFRYRRAMRGVTGRLFSASLFRDGNLRFDESLRYGEDMKLNYEAFCLAKKAVFCPVPLYTYRIHNPLSLSRQGTVTIHDQSLAQKECIRRLKKSVSV